MVRRSHSRTWALPLVARLLLLTGSLAWAFEPKQDISPVAQKAFFKPELYLSSSHSRLVQVQNSLPNKQAWTSS